MLIGAKLMWKSAKRRKTKGQTPFTNIPIWLKIVLYIFMHSNKQKKNTQTHTHTCTRKAWKGFVNENVLTKRLYIGNLSVVSLIFLKWYLYTFNKNVRKQSCKTSQQRHTHTHECERTISNTQTNKQSYTQSQWSKISKFLRTRCNWTLSVRARELLFI